MSDETQKNLVPSHVGYGSLGNGLTVWDRTVEKNGDYKTLAHIQDSGEIRWYCKRYKKGDKEFIQELAESHAKKHMGG